MNQYVKWVDLEQALNAYRKTPTPPPPPDSHPSPEAVEALQKIGELTNKLEGFLEEYKQLQVCTLVHILNRYTHTLHIHACIILSYTPYKLKMQVCVSRIRSLNNLYHCAMMYLHTVSLLCTIVC